MDIPIAQKIPIGGKISEYAELAIVNMRHNEGLYVHGN
jgi:hypothetical protein